jgi:trans-aconitate 2-methyltransferase
VTTEWDARTYERVSGPQVSWGRTVVDRIALRGDETVLDAGCGTGRVTRLLAERLPGGRVIAVDGSRAMVDEARDRLADLAPRVTVRHADLLELEVEEPVDLIVSTATFHWILDHDVLFRRLFCALKPGGRLVAQCGGAGNIAATLGAAARVAARAPYAEALDRLPRGWLFAGPDETRARLEAAGFDDARAWLVEAPAELDEESVDFLATVVLRHHLEALAPQLRVPYAEEVAAALRGADGQVVLDYVRLNMEARRPLHEGLSE